MATKRNVQYKPLSTEDQDEYDEASNEGKDLRFSYTPKKYNRIPWKSIALAIFLLLLGTMLLVLSYFIHTGHMPGDSSQANGLLFLGILAFLPGMCFSPSKDVLITFMVIGNRYRGDRFWYYQLLLLISITVYVKLHANSSIAVLFGGIMTFRVWYHLLYTG